MTRYLSITALVCLTLLSCSRPHKPEAPSSPTAPKAHTKTKTVSWPVSTKGWVLNNPLNSAQKEEPAGGDFTAHVGLSWDPSPSDDVTGYKLYANDGSGFFPVTETVVDTRSVVLENMQALHQYSFFVTAFNATDESDPSNVVYWISNSVMSIDAQYGLTLTGTTGWTYELQATSDLAVPFAKIQNVTIDATGRAIIPVDMSQPQMFFRLNRIAVN